MKKLIRLTEGDLHRIVKESVRRILKENDDPLDLTSDYNPYLNGDASYFNGKFETASGYYVEINTSLSYVDIEDERSGESYFLQGDEADELIAKICKYWSENDCDQDEAVEQIIKHMF